MRVISGIAKGTKLSSIDSNRTRPTLDRVKESLFNIIQNKIEDSTVLDLFAGSGAIGIEFLSRRAEKAYFCSMINKYNCEKSQTTVSHIVTDVHLRLHQQALSAKSSGCRLVNPQ